MRKIPKRDLVVSGGIVGAGLAVMIAAGAALIASSPAAFAACGVNGVMKTAFGNEQVQPPDVYIVNFASDSAELNPVAEQVLFTAAAAYPTTSVVAVQLNGAEQMGTAPTTVDLDRHAIVTAYLVRHDVPLSAIAFDKGQLAQTGCNQGGA